MLLTVYEIKNTTAVPRFNNNTFTGALQVSVGHESGFDIIKAKPFQIHIKHIGPLLS